MGMQAGQEEYLELHACVVEDHIHWLGEEHDDVTTARSSSTVVRNSAVTYLAAGEVSLLLFMRLQLVRTVTAIIREM
jgi:hypothetical protein